jgi:hypothetical protein
VGSKRRMNGCVDRMYDQMYSTTVAAPESVYLSATVCPEIGNAPVRSRFSSRLILVLRGRLLPECSKRRIRTETATGEASFVGPSRHLLWDSSSHVSRFFCCNGYIFLPKTGIAFPCLADRIVSIVMHSSFEMQPETLWKHLLSCRVLHPPFERWCKAFNIA